MKKKVWLDRLQDVIDQIENKLAFSCLTLLNCLNVDVNNSRRSESRHQRRSQSVSGRQSDLENRGK